MSDFSCSGASVEDEESIAGTAAADIEFLLVECPGPWGHDAVNENRLPAEIRAHLAGLQGVKVLLVRRPDGTSGPGVNVFHAVRHGLGFAVTAAVLEGPEDLIDLDLSRLTSCDTALWLVCTNGKRDRCCAEIGRPIAAALGARWPRGTWETTHLGGHRFSGTLLALPSGLTLGRLDTVGALAACAEIEEGVVPLEFCRGRAGRPGVDQVRELHVLGGGDPDVEIVAHPGPVRRQSCGDLKVKPTTCYEVRAPAGRSD